MNFPLPLGPNLATSAHEDTSARSLSSKLQERFAVPVTVRVVAKIGYFPVRMYRRDSSGVVHLPLRRPLAAAAPIEPPGPPFFPLHPATTPRYLIPTAGTPQNPDA